MDDDEREGEENNRRSFHLLFVRADSGVQNRLSEDRESGHESRVVFSESVPAGRDSGLLHHSPIRDGELFRVWERRT